MSNVLSFKNVHLLFVHLNYSTETKTIETCFLVCKMLQSNGNSVTQCLFCIVSVVSAVVKIIKATVVDMWKNKTIKHVLW